MKVVNIREAKTNLSRLLKRVEQGEEIVIGRAGKPVALLSPIREERKPRKPGVWAGQIWMAPDFDESPEDLLDAFYGEPR